MKVSEKRIANKSATASCISSSENRRLSPSQHEPAVGPHAVTSTVEELDANNSASSLCLQIPPETSNVPYSVAHTIPQGVAVALQELQKNLNDSIAPRIDAMITAMQPIADFSRLIAPAIEHLNTVFKTLARIVEEFDWNGYRSAFNAWGKFGWIIPDNMSLLEIHNVPEKLAEADRKCLQYYDKEALDILFDRLVIQTRKKRDITEAVYLFRKQHYKPCAMMLCSLIEGELIALGKRQNVASLRKGRQSGKSTLNAFRNSGLPNEGLTALFLVNFLSVWEYFFHGADDFNRELEGELNRHFLVHGMMYRPVRRKSCIKLFVLLESVTSFLPMIASSKHLQD